MKSLEQKNIVIAGGTGNVGSFIVRQLLASGAQVAVPSRSGKKVESLRSHLNQFDDVNLNNFHTFIGDISDESVSDKLLDKIMDTVGRPNGAISTLGGFIPAPSLLTVEMEKFHSVMENYLHAHFAVARLILPVLRDNGGTFIFVNGPLALNPWEGSGLVSISTAAQQMLFKSLAKELENSNVHVSELMNYAYIRNRKTQPESKVKGEAVGILASWMISDESTDTHGKTIHLDSMDKLNELGIATTV